MLKYPRRLARRLLPKLALVMMIAAGGGGPENAQALTIGGGSGDALDPRSFPFNAIPNDGEDDREKLQQWIDAGCASPNKLLYLPPGDWHVTRRPAFGTSNIGSLRILCDGLTILGSGRASRILMKGSGMLPTKPFGPVDWWVFEIGANEVSIEGIAIDGSERSNTGEQTHLIQIAGAAWNTELRRLYLNLPILAPPTDSVACKSGDPARMCVVPGHGSKPCKDLDGQPRCSVSGDVVTLLGWYQGGDCIRSVGPNESSPVNGVIVSDSYASECDRSFVGFQRNSHNFTIMGNVTRKVGDQVIDHEPSNPGGIGKVIILGNRFERGANSQGAFAISLAGNGPDSEIGDAMIVSNNIIDGGIFTYNVSRISIEHNTINGQPFAKHADAVVKIIKITDSLRLIGNEIDRPSSALHGPVVQLSEHNTGRPVDVTIALNTIRQNTDEKVIEMAGVQNVTIVDNTIQCNQPTKSFPAIRGQSAVLESPEVPDEPVPLTNLIVSQNRARGNCESLVHLAPRGESARIGAVTITENQTTSFAVGVQFGGSILPSVEPRISDNLFEGTAPANFVKGPPGLAFDGSNGPMP